MTKFSDSKITGWTQSKYSELNSWESEAAASFRERMELAVDLGFYFEDSEIEKIKNAARKNSLVNMVSALEVYFKDLIVEEVGNWVAGGFADLLKEKMSLNDAYDCFKDITVTKEALVAYYYSFQNIESIGMVFSRLTSCDFLQYIDEAEYLGFDGDCPIGYYYFCQSFPEWRKYMVAIFETRHRIIHEANLDEVLTHNTWAKYHRVLAALPSAIKWALGQRYSELRWDYLKSHPVDDPDDLPF